MRGPVTNNTVSLWRVVYEVITYREMYSKAQAPFVTYLSTCDRGGREGGGFQPPELHGCCRKLIRTNSGTREVPRNLNCAEIVNVREMERIPKS